MVAVEERLRLGEAGLVLAVELLVVGAERGVGDLETRLRLGRHRSGTSGVGGRRNVAVSLARAASDAPCRPTGASAGPARRHVTVRWVGVGSPARASCAPCPDRRALVSAPACSACSLLLARWPPRLRQRGRRRLPARLRRATTPTRRWSRTSPPSSPPTRRSSSGSRSGTSYQGRTIWAVKISDNVARRRERARGPVRRPDPLRRAHGPRDDPPDHALARRRLRPRRPDHEHRQQPRGLDHPRGQPRRRRVRHHRRRRSTSGARTASRTPGTTAIGTDLNRNFGYRWGGGGRTQHEPGRDHLPRAVRLLGARDPERPRLPRQPGRQRPAADPDGDHVPRGRPARDVAVRLHLHRRPGRHDRRRPQRARDHRPAHGRDERLQARAGERPVHHLRDDPRLRVRDVPDLRLHVRDVGRRLSRRLADPVRDRAATRRPCCT